MKDYKELLRWLRFMGKMQTSVSIYNQSADAIENLLKELHETKSELNAAVRVQETLQKELAECKAERDAALAGKGGEGNAQNSVPW